MSDTAPAEAAEDPLFSWSNQAVLVAALTVVALLGIFAIRGLALRVTQYEASVFEDYAREALAAGRHDRVIEICNGAMRAAVNRSDHHGIVYLLRAQAHAGRGNTAAALDDWDAAAVFSQESHYFMPEEARAEMMRAATVLGEERLSAGDAEGALRAFSAAAVGGGDPVGYLHALARNLPAEGRSVLWGGGPPRITVRRFDTPAGGVIERVVEEQGRAVIASGTDGGSGYIELGEAVSEGRSAYGDKLYLPLSEQPFALRVVARGESGPLPDVLLGYWFEAARRSAHTQDAGWADIGGGWQACLVERDFYRERLRHATRNGYSVSDGFISLAALEFAPDSARRVWLDRIELILPD